MGFALLVWFVLVGGLVAVVLAGAGSAPGRDVRAVWVDGNRRPTARQVLDARLARGMISREEYEAIRARIAE
jgi:uncharacterized membrane protein